MFSAGTDSATRAPPAIAIDSQGRRITRSTVADQKRDSPAASPAAEEREAALLDPVPEPGEHRRQHRQRGEHRDRDDEDRALGERVEGLVAAQEHAGHRDDHRQAGDQHRAPRGRGGDLERGALIAPGGALLALASQVEERVVDADRQPDQQDDR